MSPFSNNSGPETELKKDFIYAPHFVNNKKEQTYTLKIFLHQKFQTTQIISKVFLLLLSDWKRKKKRFQQLCQNCPPQEFYPLDFDGEYVSEKKAFLSLNSRPI